VIHHKDLVDLEVSLLLDYPEQQVQQILVRPGLLDQEDSKGIKVLRDQLHQKESKVSKVVKVSLVVVGIKDPLVQKDQEETKDPVEDKDQLVPKVVRVTHPKEIKVHRVRQSKDLKVLLVILHKGDQVILVVKDRLEYKDQSEIQPKDPLDLVENQHSVCLELQDRQTLDQQDQQVQEVPKPIKVSKGQLLLRELKVTKVQLPLLVLVVIKDLLVQKDQEETKDLVEVKVQLELKVAKVTHHKVLKDHRVRQ